MSATDFEKQWGIPARNVGLVADNDTRDRAVIARAGGNIYRRAAWVGALIDPANGSGLTLRLAIERFAPSCGHWTKTWGTGSPPSESEMRAMHGDK